jgi:uncharacterized protein
VTTRSTRTRVDVADLRRHPGERREVHLERSFDDLRVGDVEVPPDQPVALDVVLEAVQGGVEASGRAAARWRGPCRRCLEPVVGDLEVDVQELFVDDAVEGETYPIDHGVVDLAPLVREAVLLALPLAPLCREDCPGPDPEAFPVGAADEEDEEDEEGEPPRDPRWAALDVLRAELEGSDPDSRSEGPVE